MKYKVYLKEQDLKMTIEADNENQALASFKQQRVHIKGISKTDYRVELAEETK